MLRPRIIPVLLLHKGGLYKTTGFDKPKYVGDPLNAVRIFNEKEVDELMVIDIDATRLGREPDYALIRNLAAECRMPLAYGGGVHLVEQFQRLISLGVEKVAELLSHVSQYATTLLTRPHHPKVSSTPISSMLKSSSLQRRASESALAGSRSSSQRSLGSGSSDNTLGSGAQNSTPTIMPLTSTEDAKHIMQWMT